MRFYVETKNSIFKKSKIVRVFNLRRARVSHAFLFCLTLITEGARFLLMLMKFYKFEAWKNFS